jgi:accessory colonization factor AcfC
MYKVVDQYNAFKLNEYNGTFEIVSGNDNEGKFWMDWAIASEYDSSVGHGVPVKKDDGSYRNVPIKVILGNKEEAVENLKWLLSQLEGHNPDEPPEPSGSKPLPNDDVPF